MPSVRLALATLVAFAAMVTPAAAAQEQPPPWLKLENGVSAPQFAFEDAIEEVVFVETPLDTDGDGSRDRVRIRISRPAETEGEGIDVPVVFEHSPYRGDFGNAVNHNVDFEVMPQEYIGDDHKRASAARVRARARGRAAAPTSPARSTTTTSRAATRSCSARASARSTPTAARTSAARGRRSAPRP